MELKVYLAGPITGLSFTQANDWREGFGNRLEANGMCPLSPLRGKQYLLEEKKVADTYEEFPMSSEAGIFGRDCFDVYNCDIALFNFSGAERGSLGSMFEMGLAYGAHKYILSVVEPENVHNHAFVRRGSSLVVPDLETAFHTLKVLSRGL